MTRREGGPDTDVARSAGARPGIEGPDARRSGEPACLVDAATFLDAVRACLTESLAFAADAGGVVTAGLPSSVLVEVSSLETLMGDLLAAGGKLVRPRLVRLGYLAARASARSGDGDRDGGSVRDEPTSDVDAAGQASDAVVRVAAAFELLHLFGLLQDDVMDASDTRRGRPAAHRRVSAAAAQPDGPDAARLGDSVAVLAGDLAFALANRLVRGLPEHVADAWDAAVVELVTGQRLDLVFAAEARLDEVSTRRVAHAKSGAYTVQRPLEIGALLSGESAPPAWLSRFGAALGEAFALADDIIGLWGEPAVTGKPAGEDLRERKPTTVLGLADSALDGELTRRLAPGREPLDEAETRAWLERLDAVGVRAQAAARIAERRADALDALTAMPPGPVRDELTRFADELAVRDA